MRLTQKWFGAQTQNAPRTSCILILILSTGYIHKEEYPRSEKVDGNITCPLEPTVQQELEWPRFPHAQQKMLYVDTLSMITRQGVLLVLGSLEAASTREKAKN
jgi:hypothetical protein